MRTVVERVVLLPRFTTFVGAGTYHTKPMSVRRYATANLVAWAGAGTGTAPALSLTVETSPDLSIWGALGSAFSPDESEVAGSRTFSHEWMRIAVALTGTNPAITCWMTGEFTVRGS